MGRVQFDTPEALHRVRKQPKPKFKNGEVVVELYMQISATRGEHDAARPLATAARALREFFADQPDRLPLIEPDYRSGDLYFGDFRLAARDRANASGLLWRDAEVTATGLEKAQIDETISRLTRRARVETGVHWHTHMEYCMLFGQD